MQEKEKEKKEEEKKIKEINNFVNIMRIRIDEMIPTRVKTIMKREGLSQRELAEKLDISEETIKGIITRNKKPTLDVALRIVKRYNVSLDYMLGLTDYMKEEELLADKAFESFFNPQLIHKEYIDIEGKIYNVDFLSLTANDVLIQYFYSLKKCEEMKEKFTEDEYNYKIEDIKDKYYEAIKKDINIKSEHYLIPAEFAEKRFLYDLREIK